MRALVYPYHEEFAPFIRYGKCIENIKIVETLSPSGWGLQNNAVIGEVQNKNDVKEVNWDNIDALLLVDSGVLTLSNKGMLAVILYAAQNGKKIIVNRNLEDEIYLSIASICNKERVELTDMRRQIQAEELFDKRIKKLKTPVIFVAGMGEKCDKFPLQMFLKSYYEMIGYKVCAISSRSNTELYGIHSFPTFMFGNELDEESKIINYNHFVKKLEDEEKPDIVIIGIPGGILPVSDKHPEYFGIFAFEVFHAVKSDVLLFCLHNNNYTKEYFDEVQKLCKYRFHSKIDAFVIARHAYDSFSLETEGSLKYLSFTNEEVEKRILNYPENVYGNSTYEKLAEYVLDLLAEYGEYQIM